MSDVLITIIVPVYKVELYLRRCVESIIGQTYRELEIILVDDGSPDNCGAICDEYAKCDERITVIHKRNGGLSSARNAALDCASGEYLMFVDSDDWVEPDFCATALRLAYENDAQVVSFGYNMVYANHNGNFSGKQQKRVPSGVGFMDVSEAVKHLIRRDYPAVGNHVWNKLYRHSLWDGVRFPEGRLWEDQAVTSLVIIKAGSVYVSEEVLYNYVKRPDSIVGAMECSPQAYADRFCIWRDRLSIIRRYCLENERYQIVQLLDAAVSGIAFIRDDSRYRQTSEEMKDFLSTYKDVFLHGVEKRTTMIKLRLYYFFRPLLPLLKWAILAKHMTIGS